MKKLVLTHTAFDRFYGSVRLIVMSVGVHKALSGMIPDTLDVLLLDNTCVLRVPEEAVNSDSSAVGPIGAPAGLLGFIVDRRMTEPANSWSNWIVSQTGRRAPPVATIKKNKIAAMQCLAEMVMADADQSRRAAAGIQTDLANLRRDFERSLINLEKARRVIRGAGYDTRYSTLTVPIGKQTIAATGVTNPLAPYVVRYGLPVDAAGLVGISLHFVVSEGPRADGYLNVLLLRSVDSRILGRVQLQFSEVAAGWGYLALERVMQRSFGDAELALEWVVSGEGSIPEISLTDAEPDRCGELRSESKGFLDQPYTTLPAMKIWSGFAPGELADDYNFSRSLMEHRQTAISTLREGRIVIAGAGPTDTIIDQDIEGRWVQTHLQEIGPVGFAFEKLVPSTARALTVTCETAHSAAPTCFYLVAVGGPSTMTQGDMAHLLETKKAENAARGYDAQTGIAWSIQTVTPGTQHQVTVDLTSLDDNLPAQNLAMAVVSATGTIKYGWCRWYGVSVELDTVENHSTAFRSLSSGVQLVQRMRSVKFREIGDQLEFLAGRTQLQKLTDQLGFSPMMVAEDNGSLQTHPIKRGISAALYRSGAGIGTTRVSCDVETAHERAPDFLYVLALIDAETLNKHEVFEKIVSNLVKDEFHVTRGYDEGHGIHYSARRLSALQIEALTIDLDVPLVEEHDIIVAALPVQDVINYGWCRWLSLSVATTVDTHQQFVLKAESE